VKVHGIVLDPNGDPLQGASVYANGTTVGTATDAEGTFSFFIEHGYHNLVATYVGYETGRYNLNTLELPDKIVFKLVERYDLLDEIVLDSDRKKYRGKRDYFLKKFRKFFLGETPLARKTRIKNEHVIRFEYDSKTKFLEAFASEPLIIENKGLGYRITYELVHFEVEDKVGYTLLGYSKFDLLEGNERKQERWKKERKRAYFGSLRHFLQSIIKKDSTSGFMVNQVKLTPNLERPSDRELLQAMELREKYLRIYPHEIFRTISIKRDIDSLLVVLVKGNLPKYHETLIKRDLDFKDFTEIEEGEVYLQSPHPLEVTYLNENQVITNNGIIVYDGKYQKSNLTFLDEQILLHPKGLFHNPMDVKIEGNWAYKRVGDLLPLDYKPD
jgi:hypothetical protein